MTDYFSPTIVQQAIPVAEVTSLEHLALSLVFDAECEGDALIFYFETGPGDWIGPSIAELRAACAASARIDSIIAAHVRACLADAEPDDTEIDLDLSTVSWEFLLQDIVRRSPTLDHVTVIGASPARKSAPMASAAWPC